MQKTRQQGFSLVELSIVLVIIGVLASSVVLPLSVSIKQARIKRTAAQLVSVRDALHGYLISAGRLPCPISLNVVVINNSGDSQNCITQHGGIPAAELGIIGEQSANGALLDAWGRAYRYSVSLFDHSHRGQPGAADWLTVGEPAAVGASHLRADLQLCRTMARKTCAAKQLIANQIVWVVHSKGENDSPSDLQSENDDHDVVFVYSAYSSNPQKPFDDQIIWASRSELSYWLLKANWLP